MNIVLIIFQLIIAIAVLIASARFVEVYFVEFSHKFKINEFFLGFAVLALVTSLPEITIAIFSSNQAPDLSLGNLIGATTVLLTLVIGISSIKHRALTFQGKFAEKEVLMGILLLSLIVVSIFDQNLTLIEGVIMFLLYVVYIIYLYRKLNSTQDKILFLNISTHKTGGLLLKLLLGLVLLVISSSFVVDLSVDLASSIGVSQGLIGIILLAIGTNLPEITILLTAKGIDQDRLALGNFFGSACANVGILGLLSILSRGFVIGDFQSIVIGVVILFLSLLFFAYFSWTGRKIDKREGYLLVAIYIAMLISEVIVRLGN